MLNRNHAFEEIMCKLCHGVLISPHAIVRCGHTFCKSCIENYIGYKWPVCRGNKRELIRVPQLEKLIEKYASILETQKDITNLGNELIEFKNRLELLNTAILPNNDKFLSLVNSIEAKLSSHQNLNENQSEKDFITSSRFSDYGSEHYLYKNGIFIGENNKIDNLLQTFRHINDESSSHTFVNSDEPFFKSSRKSNECNASKWTSSIGLRRRKRATYYSPSQRKTYNLRSRRAENFIGDNKVTHSFKVNTEFGLRKNPRKIFRVTHIAKTEKFDKEPICSYDQNEDVNLLNFKGKSSIKWFKYMFTQWIKFSDEVLN